MIGIILVKAIDAFLIVLFIRYIISWFAPNSRNEFTHIVYKITDPIVRRCSVIVPVGRGYMDLSYIIIYFGAKILRSLIIRFFFGM